MVTRTLITILIVVASGVYAGELRSGLTFAEQIPRLAELPTEFEGWQSRDFQIPEVEARVLDADAILDRRFVRTDGRVIGVVIAYFAEQQVNSQIHSPKNCIPGSVEGSVTVDEINVDLPAGPRSMTRMLLHDETGEDTEILYWFRTRNGAVNGEFALKWDLVKNSLGRKPTDAAFIRFTGPASDPNAVREVMAHLEAPLKEILGEVGLP